MPRTEFPQLWCKYDDGSIVRRHSMTFTFQWDNRSNAVVARMRQAVAAALSQSRCEVSSKNVIQFSFAVPFAGTPAPTVVGSVLAAALIAMESVRRSLPDDE